MFENLECFCLFVGYSKSGHTLISSVLDAHPNIMISDELDILKMVDRSSRKAIFRAIIRNSKKLSNKGRTRSGYNYRIGGLYSGAAAKLQVLGDKQAGKSSWRARRDPAILSRLHEKVELPVKWIHVIRNPYDNLVAWYKSYKVHSLGVRFEQYRKMCEGAKVVREKEEVIDVYLEKFIEEPKQQIERLCTFLGVDVEKDYLDTCAKLVWKKPRKRSGEIKWEKKYLVAVEGLIGKFDWFQCYL